MKKTYNDLTKNIYGYEIHVYKKNIKNIYLRIDRNKNITISAPLEISDNYIDNFIFSKLKWIDKKINNINNNRFIKEYKYINGENHYYLGQEYKLFIISKNILMKDEKAFIKNKLLIVELSNKKAYSKQRTEKVIYTFYKKELEKIIRIYIKKWETKLKLSVSELRFKKMKTKWGTCNVLNKRLWFNTELIKRESKIIELVVLHEMAHLIEANHSIKFYNILDKNMFDWKDRQKLLNNG